MITTKIRTLLKTGVKFVWTPDHQAEFDKVIQSLSDLEKLEPYDPKNELYALVNASLCGLGFILFQKNNNSRLSILQAGSTSLKHAQVRWAIPELELLAAKYMLNKCHKCQPGHQNLSSFILTAKDLRITRLVTLLTLTTNVSSPSNPIS